MNPKNNRLSYCIQMIVGLEVFFLLLRLCADCFVIANEQIAFCFLGIAYFIETDL